MQTMTLSSQCDKMTKMNALTYLKAGEAPIIDADANADDELNGGSEE